MVYPTFYRSMCWQELTAEVSPEVRMPAAIPVPQPLSLPAAPPPSSVPHDTRSLRRRVLPSCPEFVPGTHATTPPLSDLLTPELPSGSFPPPRPDSYSPPQPAPG